MKSPLPTEEPMKLRKDTTNETRLALLEQSINNINETLQRFDKRLDKIDERFEKMNTKFDKIGEEIKDFRREINSKIEALDKRVNENLKEFNGRLWSNFLWVLATMFTLSATCAGILAKGFGWLTS